MKPYKTTLLWISRIIVGLVFIYSGFVKAVDPLGSTYKFIDYFNAFNMSWATGLSFGLAILLSAAEFIVGIAVLLNLKIKLSSWGALIFMIFFTPLTFVLALTNPVHDCGCFGDALILTNWQTFWKNIILLIPVLFLFIQRKNIQSKLNPIEQWIISGLFLISISWISIYSLNHLPLLDFRPYNVGTYIPDKMDIPEGAPADVWESHFIYSKNGEEKSFTVNNLPDSSWTFVDAKHELISKGYTPPIHDFSIVGNDGSDITDMVLASTNYNFLLVAYNLEKSSLKNQEKINKLAAYCQSMGYPFYCLTADGEEGVDKFISKTRATYPFYTTDEITLKTMVRSNPGLILIKEGTLLEKWNHNDIPEIENLSENITHQVISEYKKTGDKYYIYTLILVVAFLGSTYLLVRQKLKA